MSKIMEDRTVHDSKINVFTAEMTKGRSGRKTLADISNMPQGFPALNQGHKSKPSSDAFKKRIEQLQKDKAALMKLLADKNKVIELSGTEMQNLRVTLEKMKQQNLQLAQSNSQMLAELNSVKERQKALNHELGCKDVLINAIKSELEGKDETRMCQATDSDHNKVTEPQEIEVCTVADGDDVKHDTETRRQLNEINDKGKSKRLKTRRQSAKFNLDEPISTRESLKIENVDDVPPCSLPDDDDKTEVNDSNSVTSTSKKEDKEDDSFQDCNKPREQRKTSLSRPIREATKKVKSYKEINLVVKMRRE